MRSSDWSSDVCSSDLKPALSSISRLATDSADAAPALIHAVPGEAEMALPAKAACSAGDSIATCGAYRTAMASTAAWSANPPGHTSAARPDRKSTRLNSSPHAPLVCRLLLEKNNTLHPNPHACSLS